MDHFEGVIPDERWKNELLREVRKQTELLETLVQLLNNQGQKAEENVSVQTTRKPGRRKKAVGTK